MRPFSASSMARVAVGLIAVSALPLAAAAPVLAAKNGAKKSSPPPAIGIGSPTPGAVLTGVITVSGTASSSVGLAAVAVSVDTGAYTTASGTTSWSAALNTAAYLDGTHMVNARATDINGGSTVQSVSVTFGNGAPAVSVTSPGAGSTVTGTVTVSGTASSSAGLSQVTVSVDNGAPQSATGTSSWSYALNSGAYTTGTHTITATATSTTGTTGSGRVSVTFGAATAPTTVSITSPASGAAVSGTVTVSGSASSGAGVSSVQVSVDGGAYQPATGTGSWAYALDSTQIANGSHTITAKAVDGAGGSATSSVSVTVSNSTSGPTCIDGSAVLQQMTTPEGVTIYICTTAGGWTTTSIHDLLKANALDLTTVGPHLLIEVQTTYGSAESSSAACCDASGNWDNFHATIYLDPSPGLNFYYYPDAIMAHEYGHAWSWYWHYMNPANGASWTGYEQARGIYGNPSVGSTYCWTPFEMAADDYRILFGTPAAASEMTYLNPYVPPPTQVAGLSNWFLSTFR
jgi:hypothetical protein